MTRSPSVMWPRRARPGRTRPRAWGRGGRAAPHVALPRALFPAAWCLLCLAAARTHARDASDEEIAGIDRQVAALLAVRDNLLREVRARPAPGEPAATFRMTFPGLLGAGGSRDLTVTLFRSGGAWVWAAARADAADQVDASGLALLTREGGEGGRRLAGALVIRFAPELSGKPAFCEEVKAVIEVDALVTGAELKGTFRTEGYRPIPEIPRFDYSSSDGNGLCVEQSLVPAREGDLRGEVHPVAWSADLTPIPPDEIARDSMAAITVKRAQARDLNACELYRQIHACALALEHNLDVAHAWELTPDYRPVWPVPRGVGPSCRPRRRADALPDMDDIPDLSVEGASQPEETGKARTAALDAARGARDEEVVATVRAIGTHVETMRRQAEQYRPGPAPLVMREGGAARAVATGLDSCPDPDFGPWFGEAPLPAGGARGGRNVLPAAPVNPNRAEGPQEWRRVEGWRFLGPFPALGRRWDAPTLPEVIPAFQAGVVSRLSSAPPSADEADEAEGDDAIPAVPPGDEPVPEQTTAMSGLGLQRVPVPGSAARGSRSRPPFSFYAENELNAPADREAWVGVQIRNGGALWVNRELVWRSPAPGSLVTREEVFRFPVRLRGGSNALVLRIDSHGGEAWFAVRVSTGEGPKDAEEAARARASREAAYAKTPPATQGMGGWRGDWSGVYPEASPPLAWDLDRKINVLWEVPLAASHATPVIAGEKVFVLEDPAVLVCLDKRTGAVLWRREADFFDLLPAEVRERLGAKYRSMRKAVERLRNLGATPDERLKALVAGESGRRRTEAEATALLRELEAEARQEKGIMRECGVLGPAWGDWTSHTFSTPVTDGSHVWFKSNTGVIACYDLAGRARWIVRHDGTTGTNSHTPSPVLAGGRLIVVLPVAGLGSAKDYVRADSILAAYDASTGDLLWRVDTAEGVVGEVTGTPLPMRLTNGREAMDVVVTADGSVVRVEDGKVLRMHIGTRERWGSPTAFGRDSVGLTGGDRGQAFRSCYRLLMVDRDHVGAKPLWNVAGPGTLYDSGDYQVVRGGLAWLYGARLDAADAATGEALFRSSAVLWRRPGRCYSPIALAGKHLFIADLGNWFGMKKSSFHRGGLSVATAERSPVVLARNRVERMCSAPAFDGDRIYLRQWYSLLCAGHTGDEGRRYEAEVVARECVAGVFPGRPSGDAPVAVPAVKGEARGRLLAGRMPGSWVMLGPLPAAESEAVRAALASGGLADLAGTRERSQVSVAGVPLRAEPVRHRHSAEEAYGIMSHIVSKVGKGFREHQERLRAEGEPAAWTESVVMGDSGFPGSVMVLRGGAVPDGHAAWLATAAENGSRRVMRFELDLPGVGSGPPRSGRDLPGARAWMNGQEVGHNRLVDVPAGVVLILVEVRGAGTADDLRFAPRLWPSYGGREDLADWLSGLRQRRPYLENAARLLPDSDVGRRARALLAAASPGE